MGWFLLLCKLMYFKRATIMISVVAVMWLQTGCTNAKADTVKDGFKEWIGDLLTPSKTTLEKSKTGYTLKGNLKNKPENLMMLWEMNPETGQVFIDSVRTDKSGNFELTGNVKEPIFCQLQWADQAAIYLILENNTNANLEINPVDGTYLIEGKGTNGSSELLELFSVNTKYINQLRQIESQASGLPHTQEGYTQGMQLQGKYNELLIKRTAEIKQLAMSKEKSLLPLFIISFGLIEEPDVDLMKHAINAAKAVNPNSKYVPAIAAKYEAEKSLAIGAIAPDIKLPQPNGDSLSLSSLRGQIVLIDFWASWCGPCRKENPFNTKLYAKYHAKGFEVYGISFDENKESWKRAIATDSLVWKHVSDLKRWNCMAAPIYKISSIPATYLIDREGKIIAKGLRGEALAAKLEELFPE